MQIPGRSLLRAVRVLLAVQPRVAVGPHWLDLDMREVLNYRDEDRLQVVELTNDVVVPGHKKIDLGDRPPSPRWTEYSETRRLGHRRGTS